MHCPSSAPTSSAHTGVAPLDIEVPGDLQQLLLDLSPSDSVRVAVRDRAGRYLNSYKEVRPKPRTPPAAPWAIHLSDDHGFRWMCFDLDTKRGPVGPDLATLLRWLENAGLTYVVAASGPAGGRHVWAACSTPLDAALVSAINTAAAKRLPTLDKSPLANAGSGAVRPIGAPHRNGGRGSLLQPLDTARAAELLTPATCRNTPDAFVRLAVVIAGTPAPSDVRLQLVRERAVEVIDDDLGPRLSGTPRTLLDDETMTLLTARPAPDRVSEVLASLLDRLALRRWTWPMVSRLMTEKRHRQGGLLHACTEPGTGPLRIVLDEDKALQKLARQWSRCVAYAATLPITEESLEWTGRVDQVVADVAAIQTAADADQQRWTRKSGPADRALLDLYCLIALRSGSMVIDLDIRRAALAIGHGRSTVHRSQARRLTPDGWLAPRDSDGAAGTHELLSITAEHPAAQGGTQETPPPVGGAVVRSALISRLELRLAASCEDTFAYGRSSRLGYGAGLGHHAARVYQELVTAERPLTAQEITERTGYTARTVARHLTRMRDVLVASRAVMTVHHECPTCQAAPGERCRTATGAVLRRRRADQHTVRQQLAAQRAGTPFWRPRPGGLTTAAKALGTYGLTAARARRYAIEVEVWHWWQREVERMHAPKAGLRTGPRVHQEQTELVLTTLPRQPHRAYPRGADGRADYAAAVHRLTLRRIATR